MGTATVRKLAIKQASTGPLNKDWGKIRNEYLAISWKWYKIVRARVASLRIPIRKLATLARTMSLPSDDRSFITYYRTEIGRSTSEGVGITKRYPNNWRAGGPPLLTGVCLAPTNMPLLHVGYDAEFDGCWSDAMRGKTGSSRLAFQCHL